MMRNHRSFSLVGADARSSAAPIIARLAPWKMMRRIVMCPGISSVGVSHEWSSCSTTRKVMYKKAHGRSALKSTMTPRVDPTRSGALSIRSASTVAAASERTALTCDAGCTQLATVAVTESSSTQAITCAPTR